MGSMLQRGKLWTRIIASLVLCFFFFQTSLSQAEISKTNSTKTSVLLENQDLAAISNINPIGTININGEVTEDPAEIVKRMELTKQDAGFMYSILLAKYALENKIGPASLSEKIKQDLGGLDLGNFLLDEMYEEDGKLCIPYKRIDGAGKQVLKFFLEGDIDIPLDEDGNPSNPFEHVLMRFGDVTVILEDPIVEEVVEEKMELPFRLQLPVAELPIDVKIKSVERKGVVILPDEEKEDFILNAGVLFLDGRRLLFARRATEIVVPPKRTWDGGIRRSEIGLFMHDPASGQAVEIDREMILPDGESIVALEDARVIERDGMIHVFLTAVRKDGSYYSAVMTHDTVSFVEKMRAKLSDPGESVEWAWSAPKMLIIDPVYSRQNCKNFVPYGNPIKIDGEEYWCALYRPEEYKSSTIRLAVSKVGLDGPWQDAGLYKKSDREDGWIGTSGFIAEIPSVGGDIVYNFMLHHNAHMRTDEEGASEGIKKYYDIAMIVADGEDLKNYSSSEPFLVPEKGQPYEMDGWVPGAIYSCGGILTGFDKEKGEYTFDIYYSGSDTAVLMATVTIELAQKETTRLQMEKVRLIEESKNEFQHILEEFEKVKKSFEQSEIYEGIRHNDMLIELLEKWDVLWAGGFVGRNAAGDDTSETIARIVSEIEKIGTLIGFRRVNFRYEEDPIVQRDTEARLKGLFRGVEMRLASLKANFTSPDIKVDTKNFVSKTPQSDIYTLREEMEDMAKGLRDLNESRKRTHREETLYEITGKATEIMEKIKLWRHKWITNSGVVAAGPGVACNLVYEDTRDIMRELEYITKVRATFKEEHSEEYRERDYRSNINEMVRMLNSPILDIHSRVSSVFSHMERAFIEVTEAEELERQKRIRRRDPLSDLKMAKIEMAAIVREYSEFHRYEDYAKAHERRAQSLKFQLIAWSEKWADTIKVGEKVNKVISGLEEIENMSRNVFQKPQYWYLRSNLAQIEDRDSLESLEYKLALYMREISEKVEETVFSEETDEKARKFVKSIKDSIRWKAIQAKKEGKNILLALDTGWVPGGAMQPLLSEIFRLSTAEGLDNIIIVRGEGTDLAKSIFDKQEEKGVVLSNIIVLGSQRTVTEVRNDAFAHYRSFAFEEKALLVGVDPRNLTDHSYVNILGMIEASFKLAFGRTIQEREINILGVKAVRDKHHPRIWTFIPDARAMDLEELKELVDAERRALVSA